MEKNFYKKGNRMKKRYKFLVTAIILSTCLGCSKTDADRNASAGNNAIEENGVVANGEEAGSNGIKARFFSEKEMENFNEAIEKDVENAMEIATTFSVAVSSKKISEGTYTSVPEGIDTIEKFSDSYCTPGVAEWLVVADDVGIESVSLNGILIWPDAGIYRNYMTPISEEADIQELISRDIDSGRAIASAFNMGVTNGKISKGIYTTAPQTIGLPEGLFDSFCTPGTAEWSVVVGEAGVSNVSLNGVLIWPMADMYEIYMTPIDGASREDLAIKDIKNAQTLATYFQLAFIDNLVKPEVYTTFPTELNITKGFPDSYCTPGTAEWSIAVLDDGVNLITLNGSEIWPDPSTYKLDVQGN